MHTEPKTLVELHGLACYIICLECTEILRNNFNLIVTLTRNGAGIGAGSGLRNGFVFWVGPSVWFGPVASFDVVSICDLSGRIGLCRVASHRVVLCLVLPCRAAAYRIKSRRPGAGSRTSIWRGNWDPGQLR